MSDETPSPLRGTPPFEGEELANSPPFKGGVAEGRGGLLAVQSKPSSVIGSQKCPLKF